MRSREKTCYSPGRITLPFLLAGICFWVPACDKAPTAADPEPSVPQFARPPGDMTPVKVTYGAKGTDKIYGDGISNEGPGPQNPDAGDPSTYTDDICGVTARINTGNTDDLLFDPDNSWSKKNERAGCVRRSTPMELDDPVDFICSDQPELCAVVTHGTFMNVNEVGCLLRNPDGTCLGDPPVGVAIKSTAQFNSPFCAHGLRFDEEESIPGVDVHNVWVTLTQVSPKRVWEVQTLPGEDVAVCRPDEHGSGKGKSDPNRVRHYYHLPFRLIIEEM